MCCRCVQMSINFSSLLCIMLNTFEAAKEAFMVTLMYALGNPTSIRPQ